MAEISLSKKEIIGRLNSIRVKPDDLLPRQYGISVKYYKNDENVPEKRIDYEAEISLEILHGTGEITINKKNVFYNQHEPDLINEIIADSISKSLYPVTHSYNEKGIVGKDIINHEEILKRWQDQKALILEKYSSEDLDAFFKVVDDKFVNKIKLQQSLNYDWFWNLFFHPILINYGERRKIETELFLAVIPYQLPLRFTGLQTIEKIPTDYHSFKVDFKSKELKSPRYFYPKKAEEELNLFMSLTVNFDFDLYHHFPMHIRAYFQVYSKNWEGKKVLSRRIEFTMYQTNSEIYKTKQLSEKSPFITGGLVKLPPNKWGFDNFEKIENDW